MDLELIERRPVTFACLRLIGPCGPQVGAFWANQVEPRLAAGGWSDPPRRGVSHDDPCTTDPALCRHDTGAALPPGHVAKERVFVSSLPGGRYATLRFKGSGETIGARHAPQTGGFEG